MNGYIYNAAVIRFRPYRDTGEFVNIGIIVHFPQNRYTRLKIQPKTKRITDFFPEIERKFILDTYSYIKAEVNSNFPRKGKSPETPAFDIVTEIDMSVFQHFISIHEGLIVFSSPITGFADDFQKKCEELFDYYVNRNFAESKLTAEQRLENQFSKTLTSWKLKSKFQPGPLGNKLYQFRVPFRHQKLSIRTVVLDRDTSSEIYECWDNWICRINRLRTIAKVDTPILFPVRLPATSSQNYHVAQEAIKDWNSKKGILACTIDDEEQIKSHIRRAVL